MIVKGKIVEIDFNIIKIGLSKDIILGYLEYIVYDWNINWKDSSYLYLKIYLIINRKPRVRKEAGSKGYIPTALL